jgi:hypothetical protein
VGSNSSIAVDSNKKAHIVYDSCTIYACGLQYATNASGAWKLLRLESPQERRDGSIAVDSQKKIHIVFNKGYTTNKSGTWVTSENVGGLHPSIAIDAHDNPHVAYIADNQLKYATTNGADSWDVKTVDATSVDPRFASIAIDSQGKIHISYIGNGKLMYVTNTSGSWDPPFPADDTINSGNVDAQTSIAVDSNDHIHIVYYNYFKYQDLKYATNVTGSWQTETIDSEGDIGPYNAIAIDQQDKIHVCYYDKTNRDLKYATKVSGTWTPVTVDSTGNVGAFCSIAIDSENVPHVSYQDGSNQDLKYARKFKDTFDTIPPVNVRMIAPGDGQTLAGTVTVQGTAQDDSGTVQKIEFFFGGSSVPQCTDSTPKPSGSIFECQVGTDTLADGAWLMYARAFDPSGNATESPKITVTISNTDATSPVAGQVVPTPQFGTFIGASFNLSAVFTDHESDITSCQYTIDGTTWFPADLAGNAPTFTCTKTGILGVDGLSLMLNMRATSSGGIGTGTTVARTVDTASPTGTISINSGAAFTASTAVTLSLTCNDGTGSGCAQMAFSNDNTTYTAFEAFASSKAYTLSGGDASKTVYMKCKDTVGNTSGAFSASIVLDTTAPDTVIARCLFRKSTASSLGAQASRLL